MARDAASRSDVMAGLEHLHQPAGALRHAQNLATVLAGAGRALQRSGQGGVKDLKIYTFGAPMATCWSPSERRPGGR
jgi:hypothetical protein